MPRILVAEDDDALSRMYLALLSREGFEVEAADTGALTLFRIEQDKIDLILLDMMMPGESGLDVLKELNKNPTGPRPKIIVTSNIDNPSIIAQAKAEGIDGYFVKSNVEPEEIVSYIKKVLAAPTI